MRPAEHTQPGLPDHRDSDGHRRQRHGLGRQWRRRYGGTITIKADTGGTINDGNPLTLDVQGFGGSGGGAGAGGAGTGGYAAIEVGASANMTFGGSVVLDADGFGGGSGSGAGGVGTGGSAALNTTNATTGGAFDLQR